MYQTLRVMGVATAVVATLICTVTPSHAASAAKIDREVSSTLTGLYAQNPAAKALGEKAHAVLVFPSILKAGFIVGGQGGNGALRQGDKTVGYYSSVAASYGLQAGVESFGYALFFMSKSSLEYLHKTRGWEIGTGPTVVIVDEGFAKSFTTTTLKDDVYAVIFDQKGLMAGIGIQGSKITRIHPSK